MARHVFYENSPRNRIRAYTRWPNDRAERIDAAKTEVAAALFFQRLGVVVPKDIMERANRACDVLCDLNVPVGQWE